MAVTESGHPWQQWRNSVTIGTRGDEFPSFNLSRWPHFVTNYAIVLWGHKARSQHKIVTCFHSLLNVSNSSYRRRIVLKSQVKSVQDGMPLPWASGNPVAFPCAWNLVSGVLWNATGERIVGSQCVSRVPQCASSGRSVCSNYANYHWIAIGTLLGDSTSQCGFGSNTVYL